MTQQQRHEYKCEWCGQTVLSDRTVEEAAQEAEQVHALKKGEQPRAACGGCYKMCIVLGLVPIEAAKFTTGKLPSHQEALTRLERCKRYNASLPDDDPAKV